MPSQSIATDPVTGLIEIKRFGEFKRDLIACLERLDGVGQRHERMGGELEVNVVLIAEMFNPMHLRARSRTVRCRDPDMLGPQAHGSYLRRHCVAAQKLGGNEVDGRRAEPARDIGTILPLINLARGAEVKEKSLVSYADPVRHRHGLDLVL